ncbi:cytochrome c-type biogenesis protein [Sphingoaurantiacus capsulatus]|uniref:Cytochrome c-type biogenesis protein n=1 Tax=Sphingoaurantiacus capsulatus TaxID=1771310 RepID=A0ABV7X8Q1_9SPHN
MRALRFLLLASLFVAGTAGAVLPDEQLADPALEARARAISKELRCVVCQNQSIDDSDAPLARDLRIIVREQLSAGKSDDQTMDYVVARYGNFVLLKPPFEPATWALWLLPMGVLVIGGIGVARYLKGRRHAAADTPDLTPEERARVDALLRDS